MIKTDVAALKGIAVAAVRDTGVGTEIAAESVEEILVKTVIEILVEIENDTARTGIEVPAVKNKRNVAQTKIHTMIITNMIVIEDAVLIKNLMVVVLEEVS